MGAKRKLSCMILLTFNMDALRLPSGLPHLGYGHIVKQGEHFKHGINEQQAETLLRQDVQTAQCAVLRIH